MVALSKCTISTLPKGSYKNPIMFLACFPDPRGISLFLPNIHVVDAEFQTGQQVGLRHEDLPTGSGAGLRERQEHMLQRAHIPPGNPSPSHHGTAPLNALRFSQRVTHTP